MKLKYILSRELLYIIIFSFLGCSLLPQNNIFAEDTPFIETDYYYGFTNTDGSLSFTNKETGNIILDSSIKYFFDYGTIVDKNNIGNINNSFETDTDSDGIPDGWIIDKTDIRQSSEQVSQGAYSLKFDLTATDTDHRRAYSPLITVGTDKIYEINADSYLKSLTTGYPRLFVSYYTTVDGSGKAYFDELAYFPPGIGQWFNTKQTWQPPARAKSFRILVYCPQNDVEVLYVDNISVTEIGLRILTNGTITSSIVTNGDDVVVSSTDNSNQEVTVEHKYELNRHSPNILYTATIKYNEDVVVSTERFDFTVPTQMASVMTRDLKLIKFNSNEEYYSDYFTPKVVKFNNGLSFLGNDSMQSMSLRSYDNTSSLVSFYSDHYLNHPHDNIVKNGNGDTIDSSKQKRFAGYSYKTSVSFHINTSTTPVTIVKTRQPDGYDAVLLFSNHPDQETTASVNAIAYGTEDVTNSVYGTKGIVARGIGWTKGVFIDEQPGADLKDADYKALTDKLFSEGVEIVPHSITPDTDSRDVVNAGLSIFQQYNTHDWIDHGRNLGIANWEDLSSQGTIIGDENYILDILDSQGYDMAWSYNDVGVSGINMLIPDEYNRITPYFFYNSNIDDNYNDDKQIYIWTTLSTVWRTDIFFGSDNVDGLISQRGVCIAHDYLGYPLNKNHTWYINPETNKIEITPVFDGELAYIQGKKETGLLWTPTMATFGNYLRNMSMVSIETNTDNTYLITNNGNQSVSGLTLLAESVIKSVELDNKALSSFGGTIGEYEIVLPVLNPHQSYELHLTINNPNRPPVAVEQNINTEINTNVDITLSATDADNDVLFYSMVKEPLHGIISGKVPSLTYQPETGYTGVDDFTFIVNDGKVDSAVAHVSINVTPAITNINTIRKNINPLTIIVIALLAILTIVAISTVVVLKKRK